MEWNRGTNYLIGDENSTDCDDESYRKRKEII